MSMFIAVKDSKVTAIHETEWQCRRLAKGLDKSAYWTWLKTVTTEDEKGTKSYDFSGEDYEIVEVNDSRSYESKEVDDEGNPIVVWVDTLSYESKDEKGVTITIPFTTSGHIHTDLDGTHYHLKWDASKKVIVKDDTSLQASKLAQEWKSVRNERDRKLAETDYLALKDNTLSTAMKTYRQALRDVPASNSDPKKVTWPTKPS